MANIKQKRKENTNSNLFVDSTCIDCGTCYWIAPSIFQNTGGLSAVIKDPETETEEFDAYRALFSCPTNSIGAEKKNDLYKKSVDSFPYLIEENVYHNGFHSESSFGATSYFIQDDSGNYLIDSPRFFNKLVSKIKDLGGIKQILLTHKDDVADSGKFCDKFGCSAHIHEDDYNSNKHSYAKTWGGSKKIQYNNDMQIIPVPGHTKGSVVFLYKDKYLFTGDHLCWSQALGQLIAFKNACWYDFEVQTKSMETLLDYNFTFILPGHGTPYQAESVDEMKRELEKCVKWMKI